MKHIKLELSKQEANVLIEALCFTRDNLPKKDSCIHNTHIRCDDMVGRILAAEYIKKQFQQMSLYKKVLFLLGLNNH